MSGAPQTILAGVAVNDRLSANFSVSSSRDATLLAQRGVGFLMSELIWVDREGKLLGTVAGPNLFFSPRLSNDGTLLAVDRSSMKDGLGDIWIYDLGRGVPTRLTFQAENESGPQWSRDDRFVYFHRGPQGASSIERTSAGGTGESESVVVSSPEKRLSHVSRDGRWILFDVLAGEMRSDIWVYSADDKTAKAWLSTPFNERGAELSPDGRWIAYQSDESGQSEIYVRTFPRGDRKWLITAGGGAMPAWRADGRELFYVSPDEKMMSVPIGAGEEFLPGTPAPLFDAHVRSHANRQFDVAPDGSRFLLNRVASAPPQPLTLIVNALAEVEE